MPLLNILASGVHSLSTCLEIAECTGHMSKGGKKDGEYLLQQFIPHIKSFKTKKPNIADLVIFDGAFNVQRAGHIIAELFPRISVIHGAEHVMSLFFSDLFKQPELLSFIKIHQAIYKQFGSGAMHAPYAIFQKYAKEHTKNRKLD